LGVKLSDQPLDLGATVESGKAELASKKRAREYWPGAFTLEEGRFFRQLYRVDGHPYASAENVGTPPSNFDQSYIPCSFDIRYKYETRNPRTGQGQDRGMRPMIKERFGRAMAETIFGYVRGSEGRASRVHVSHLYRRSLGEPYLLKVWGDVDQKDAISKAIQEYLTSRPGFRMELLEREEGVRGNAAV